MNEIINQVDLDHDGKVSFDEFVVMLDLKQTQEKVWFIFSPSLRPKSLENLFKLISIEPLLSS